MSVLKRILHCSDILHGIFLVNIVYMKYEFDSHVFSHMSSSILIVIFRHINHFSYLLEMSEERLAIVRFCNLDSHMAQSTRYEDYFSNIFHAHFRNF